MLALATHNRYDVLLANLPYVPDGHSINEAAKHEPAVAVFSGSDGLDAYRQFWHEVPGLDWQPEYIFTEALTPQHKDLIRLAKAAGYELVTTQGLVQQFTMPRPSS